MRLSIDISFEQLLAYIRRQLSVGEKEKLVAEIQKELHSVKKETNKSDLQEILLKGPTWTEEEYQNFIEVREQLNRFGTNDSA